MIIYKVLDLFYIASQKNVTEQQLKENLREKYGLQLNARREAQSFSFCVSSNFVLKQNKTCDIFRWKNIGGIKGK